MAYNVATAVLVVLAITQIVTSQNDLVSYDATTQSKCVQVTNEAPQRGCQWYAGLYSNIDQVLKGGRIIAYQLQWSSGAWTNWYVPGVNDLDIKFNVGAVTCALPGKAKGLRRMWSYFTDHYHTYIICKDQ